MFKATTSTRWDRRRWTNGTSDKTGMQPQKVRRWRLLSDCSRHEQRRLEQLGRRRDSRVRLTISDEDELKRSRWQTSTFATWQSLSTISLTAFQTLLIIAGIIRLFFTNFDATIIRVFFQDCNNALYKFTFYLRTYFRLQRITDFCDPAL